MLTFSQGLYNPDYRMPCLSSPDHIDFKKLLHHVPLQRQLFYFNIYAEVKSKEVW